MAQIPALREHVRRELLRRERFPSLAHQNHVISRIDFLHHPLAFALFLLLDRLFILWILRRRNHLKLRVPLNLRLKILL